MSEENKMIIFDGGGIRNTRHNNEWWFVVVDVVAVLTDSKNPSNYIKNIRRRDESLSKIWDEITMLLSIETEGGKQRMTCSNTEGLFRIIQSIPSPKAEPFKQWLAKVGYERIQEIEDPSLTAERARQYYLELGYDEEWIAKRLQSVEVRGKLTDEWKSRGVKEGIEYSILTAEISRATFGMSPSEYKKHKDLKRENLRDHMSDLELIFTMLGETATKKEAQETDAKGFIDNKKAAIKGGQGAGDALQAYEQSTGQKVVSDKNFKAQILAAKQEQKKLKAEAKKIDAEQKKPQDESEEE